MSEAGAHEVTIFLVAKFGWEGPRSSPVGSLEKTNQLP